MGWPGGDDQEPAEKEPRREAGKPARAIGELNGSANRYKIKLRSVGYRLVYEVRDAELVVSVVAVGKRERNAVYRDAAKRQQ